MSTCSGITRDGRRCTLPAGGSSGMCWLHDPSRAHERHQHASRAARSKGNKEVATLKAELKELIAKVEDGTLEPPRGNTMLRGYGVLIDLIRLERGIFVEDDLARRIEELKRERREVS